MTKQELNARYAKTRPIEIPALPTVMPKPVGWRGAVGQRWTQVLQRLRVSKSPAAQG